MAKCIGCENEVLDAGEPEYCCSGHMCGCMGKAINPPICKECWDKAMQPRESERPTYGDLLDAEQIDSIYRKADSARADEAHLRHDVFDLIESHNKLLAEVERLQQANAALLEGLHAIANTSGFKSDIYYTNGVTKYQYARDLLALYGGKGDTET